MFLKNLFITKSAFLQINLLDMLNAVSITRRKKKLANVRICLLSKSENSCNKNVFWKKFSSRNSSELQQCKLKTMLFFFAKFRDLCDQNFKVVLGQKMFFWKLLYLKIFLETRNADSTSVSIFVPKFLKLFCPKYEKIFKFFFIEKNSYSKRLLWTYKKRFWKSCSELFAEKTKTDLRKYEKKSWREFFQIQKSDFYWKCSPWHVKSSFDNLAQKSSEKFWELLAQDLKSI